MTLIGQTLVAQVLSDTARPTIVYSPWFPRQGNNLTSTLDGIALGGASVKITVDLLHKNRDDTGNGTLNSVSSGTNYLLAAGVTSFRHVDCKELVRYRATLSVSVAEPSGTYILYAILRMLQPSWEWTGA